MIGGRIVAPRGTGLISGEAHLRYYASDFRKAFQYDQCNSCAIIWGVAKGSSISWVMK